MDWTYLAAILTPISAACGIIAAGSFGGAMLWGLLDVNPVSDETRLKRRAVSGILATLLIAAPVLIFMHLKQPDDALTKLNQTSWRMESSTNCLTLKTDAKLKRFSVIFSNNTREEHQATNVTKDKIFYEHSLIEILNQKRIQIDGVEQVECD